MEFKIDFGNVAPPPASEPPDTPRFAAAPGVLLPLGGDEVVFRLRADGSHHVMTRQVFDALARCAGFQSLDRHAAAIAGTVAGLSGQNAAVRRVLEHLVGRGLLLSAHDWLTGLRATSPAEPSPLRGVFVHAASGSPHAAALLDALAAAEAAHRSGHRCVVLDDGGVPGLGEAIARLRAVGAPVVHLDAARRRALGEAIARAVPQAAPALPLLLGAGPGAARNLAVLLSAGARLVLLDAACGLPLHEAAGIAAGVDLAASAALPARFHPRADDALAEGASLAGDPVALLARDCGLALARLVDADGRFPLAPPDLAGLAPTALTHLAAATRIAAVAVGRRGPARERGREWLFELEAGSREAFWADRDLYLRTLERPCLWRGPARARLLARGLEAPVALDASALLPPSLPVGEGADALFGLFLQAVRPHDAVLVQPWSLAVCDSAPPRPTGATWAPETPGLGSLLTDLLAPRAAELRAAAPEARLRGLAAALTDLAAAPSAQHAELLHEYLGFCRAELVARLQAAFAAASAAPVHWQADVRALIEANGRALTAAGAPALDGWPDGLDAAACSRRFAAELGAFAAAVEAWPALWAHACERGAALLDA